MSSLPTFFLPPNAFHDRNVTVRDADMIHQMRKVFRLKPGDSFVALDGARHEYTCTIASIERETVRATVTAVAESKRETTIPLYCYPSLIRRERLTTIFEKCTELGVATFHPIAAARSPFHDISAHFQKRFEHIIREGAEVARRGILPVLLPVASLKEALAAIPNKDCVIVLTTSPSLCKEGRGVVSSQALPALLHGAANIHLFIGPEGDYTDDEYALFVDRGAIFLSLGPRIVRSETAAIAGVAIIATLL